MDFCKTFNARTQSQAGLIIPVVVTVYADRSYTFITKTPPASILLIKAAGLEKGSGVPNRDKVGKVTQAQVEEIARHQAAGPQRREPRGRDQARSRAPRARWASRSRAETASASGRRRTGREAAAAAAGTRGEQR